MRGVLLLHGQHRPRARASHTGPRCPARSRCAVVSQGPPPRPRSPSPRRHHGPRLHALVLTLLRTLREPRSPCWASSELTSQQPGRGFLSELYLEVVPCSWDCRPQSWFSEVASSHALMSPTVVCWDVARKGVRSPTLPAAPQTCLPCRNVLSAANRQPRSQEGLCRREPGHGEPLAGRGDTPFGVAEAVAPSPCHSGALVDLGSSARERPWKHLVWRGSEEGECQIRGIKRQWSETHPWC